MFQLKGKDWSNKIHFNNLFNQHGLIFMTSMYEGKYAEVGGYKYLGIWNGIWRSSQTWIIVILIIDSILILAEDGITRAEGLWKVKLWLFVKFFRTS